MSAANFIKRLWDGSIIIWSAVITNDFLGWLPVLSVCRLVCLCPWAVGMPLGGDQSSNKKPAERPKCTCGDTDSQSDKQKCLTAVAIREMLHIHAVTEKSKMATWSYATSCLETSKRRGTENWVSIVSQAHKSPLLMLQPPNFVEKSLICSCCWCSR